MENKNKKYIVLVTILMILVLGLGGFIVYDKVLKEDKTTNNENSNSENSNNENTNVSETSNPFELFRNNLIQERNEKFDESKDRSLSYSLNEKTAMGNYFYELSLNKDGDLIVNFSQSDLIDRYGNSVVLAHNVLLFNSVNVGNGGMKVLYFVKEDGTVSSINLEQQLEVKGDFNVTDNVGNFKDIINIIPSSIDLNNAEISDSTVQPFFIDINGKIFTLNY